MVVPPCSHQQFLQQLRDPKLCPRFVYHLDSSSVSRPFSVSVSFSVSSLLFFSSLFVPSSVSAVRVSVLLIASPLFVCLVSVCYVLVCLQYAAYQDKWPSESLPSCEDLTSVREPVETESNLSHPSLFLCLRLLLKFRHAVISQCILRFTFSVFFVLLRVFGGPQGVKWFMF